MVAFKGSVILVINGSVSICIGSLTELGLELMWERKCVVCVCFGMVYMCACWDGGVVENSPLTLVIICTYTYSVDVLHVHTTHSHSLTHRSQLWSKPKMSRCVYCFMSSWPTPARCTQGFFPLCKLLRSDLSLPFPPFFSFCHSLTPPPPHTHTVIKCWLITWHSCYSKVRMLRSWSKFNDLLPQHSHAQTLPTN